MFRTSAPVEGPERSRLNGSRKWIRRLTSSTRLSETIPGPSSEKSHTPKSRKRKSKRRSQTSLTDASTSPIISTRSRPHVAIPVPVHGYLSTRRIKTPQRPTTPKQRRLGTPIRNSGGAHPFPKQPRRSHDRRPGSAKSSRSQSVRTTRRDFDEGTSLKSATSEGPAYLSCLDDYLFAPSPSDSYSIATHGPAPSSNHHGLWINTFKNDASSRAVSPALPSATSWMLEKSLEDLWGWQDDQNAAVAHQASELSYRTSESEATLADEDESDAGGKDDRTVEKAFDGVRIAVTDTSLPVTSTLKSPPSFSMTATAVRPLNITRPTLTLPLDNHARRPSNPTSSSYLVSPSSTLVGTPTMEKAIHPKEEVWTAVSALRASWEEAEEDVMSWMRRPAVEDDAEDALLCYRRLSARQKKLGNYI